MKITSYNFLVQIIYGFKDLSYWRNDFGELKYKYEVKVMHHMLSYGLYTTCYDQWWIRITFGFLIIFLQTSKSMVHSKMAAYSSIWFLLLNKCYQYVS